MSDARYRLIGGNGSPFACKLRAILRYRRIPYDWVLRTPGIAERDLRGLKVRLMPVLLPPGGGAALLDSTPTALALEQLHPAQRSIVPSDPVHAFVSFLIEDMTDEWLAKATHLFHWEQAADQDNAARWTLSDTRPDLSGGALDAAAAILKARNVGRMALIGCTPQNAPVIRETLQRTLAALAPDVGYGRYLFGSRPALGDFGLFGQLHVLAASASGSQAIRRRAPDVMHWVRRLGDASGIEGTWLQPGEPLPGMVTALLRLAGEAYLPFLVANLRALETNRDRVALDIFGMTYVQPPFAYQAKCLRALRAAYATLDDTSQDRADELLAATGCLPFLVD